MNQVDIFNLRIRAATAGDNILLAEMGRQTFYDTFAADNNPEDMQLYLEAAFSPEKQAAELADPASVFLIAEIDGEAVGYVRLKEGPPPQTITGSKPVEIVRIYARKEWIGHGVGAALMEASIKEAEKRGCDAVWLDVWEKNPRGIAFYRKWGFVQAGGQKFLLGNDLQDDLLMQRPVRS